MASADAYIDGMQRAVQTDATAICQMDADFSHDPADVPRLVSHAATADLVIGSRYMPGGCIENWSRRRIILSTFANRYVRAITRLEPHDVTSGFRCWRREALMRLPLDRIASNGYAFQVEMAWEATAAGCRIVEVPITFVERRQGVSKLSSGIMFESMLLPWRLAARRSPPLMSLSRKSVPRYDSCALVKPADTSRPPGVSFFFPAYNDGGTIASLVIRAVQVASRLTPDFEIIVVNDGSTDDTKRDCRRARAYVSAGSRDSPPAQPGLRRSAPHRFRRRRQKT